jgi:hypothetical protein
MNPLYAINDMSKIFSPGLPFSKDLICRNLARAVVEGERVLALRADDVHGGVPWGRGRGRRRLSGGRPRPSILNLTLIGTHSGLPKR